jgi:NitT/TauT family transport system substrate-binding protein
MMMIKKYSAVLVAAATALGLAACGTATGASLGSAGKPVNLVIGYQPYYSEAWTAAVLRGTGLWKKYLPPNSTVTFQPALQGSIEVGQMLAGKEQIGYMSNIPAIVGTSKRPVRDLRIVASIGSSDDQCGVFLVRKDAPSFSSQAQAIKWMNGKTVATPFGSCSDLVAQAVFRHENVHPKNYLNQSIDLITSDFQRGSIDAAVIWEPVPSHLVNAGLARRVASGNFADVASGAVILMSEQLIKQRPDIVKDWLKAELAAERYMADPAHATAIVKMTVGQTIGYTAQDMRDALYRAWPVSAGGAPDGVKLAFPFTIGPAQQRVIASNTAFLYKIQSLASPQLPPGAVDGSFAQAVLNSAHARSPVGEIKAMGG